MLSNEAHKQWGHCTVCVCVYVCLCVRGMVSLPCKASRDTGMWRKSIGGTEESEATHTREGRKEERKEQTNKRITERRGRRGRKKARVRGRECPEVAPCLNMPAAPLKSLPVCLCLKALFLSIAASQGFSWPIYSLYLIP